MRMFRARVALNGRAILGLDQNGLPNDPIAIAQDALSAHEDKSQAERGRNCSLLNSPPHTI
jgi:hypothetical protein